MEVKVQCTCGTRYKFDVEPINGLMPGPVSCPTCGADGTAASNAIIQQSLSSQAGALGSVGVQPTSPDKPRIRLNLPVRPEPAVAAAEPPPAALSPTRSPKMTAARPRSGVAKEPSVLFGALGAMAGGFLGMLGWYFLIKATGYEIGYAAWGVGVIAGVGARIPGHSGNNLLGICAGACALVAIIGGQFLAAKSTVNEIFEKAAKEAYETQLASAKEAVRAIPTASDAEIKAFLARDNADPNQISDEEIQQFRQKELPKLREFASGKRGRKDIDKNMQDVKDSMVGDFLIFKESFSLFTLLWIFLGVGSAYKIASGGSD
ncbi:MAG TPA: hypothetical protein VEL06_02020 [Haliangiales bacterium]|nr:hypothetical protein [Haliangiales bacterium]